MKLDVIGHNAALLQKLKLLGNEKRFRIIELTSYETPNISELSATLKLSYTKCADYVALLEKHGLVQKNKSGKEVKIKSRVKLHNSRIEFV